MSMKEFDKLEEKIAALIGSVKALREENQKLKAEVDELKSSLSEGDSEKGEIRKKIAALLELASSAE